MIRLAVSKSARIRPAVLKHLQPRDDSRLQSQNLQAERLKRANRTGFPR